MKLKLQIAVLLTIIIAACNTVNRDESVERGKALWADKSLSTNGVSCQTCHPDNANTWRQNFNVGLINPVSGLTRTWDTHSIWEVANTAPYLWGGEWTGSLKELTRHVVNNIMHKATPVSEQELDDLVAYMNTVKAPLSPFLNTNGTLTERQEFGKQLFDDPARGNCASCHGGKYKTSPEVYRVDEFGVTHNDTIVGPNINPPTLLGMWDTAPYWHNGKFKTIREVIDGHPWIIGPRKEILPKYTESEKQALEDYLNSL